MRGPRLPSPRKRPMWWSDEPRYYATAELLQALADFDDRMTRPPKGSAATAGGRSHLPQLSKAAKEKRLRLAREAFHLRVINGLSQRQIAAEIGVSQATIAGWLRGVPRLDQHHDQGAVDLVQQPQ